MHVLTLYAITAFIAFIPALAALRGAGANHREQLVAGLIVTMAWPLTLPVILHRLTRPAEVNRRVVASR